MKTVRCTALALLAAAGLAGAVIAADPPKTDPKTTPAPAAKPSTPAGHDAKPATAPAAGHGDQKGMPGMEGMDPKMMEKMGEMMKACEAAAKPGKMHEWLAKGAGTWNGKCKFWMTADSPAQESTCTSVITMVMDGKFARNETTGDMPGMGDFMGLGLCGFDNVSQKFQTVWIDSMGTGMMTGTGDLSSDEKTLTITCTGNCPVQKKPVSFREIHRHTGDNTFTLEMYGPDPMSGKEYKMMEIAYTRGTDKKADAGTKAPSKTTTASAGDMTK
jgi:hypothetical protein